MVLKILGVIFAIILAILSVFGFAAMVFVAICIKDDKERAEINNKSSE